MLKAQCQGCEQIKNLVDNEFCASCFNVMLAPYGAYIEDNNG